MLTSSSSKVLRVETELARMSAKVDEMHAVLMQAKGVRWAIVAAAGLVGFVTGISQWIISKACERAMAKRISYDVISYGEWTRSRTRDFREQCCNCGLIHRLDFRIVDGKIEFRTRRDDRATAAARRTFKFTADE